MANIYVSSASYAAVATWAASTAYTSTANGGRGSYVRQLATPATGSERVFRCTTSGTSLASEPAWTLTKNATTTEAAGPVWTECTGQEADQVAGTWRAPHSRLMNALVSTWGAAGDTIFVGGNHAESQASALTLTFPGTALLPNNIICVSATGSVPPVSADILATATVVTTGNNALVLAGGTVYIYGITFRCGTGAVNATLTVGNGNGYCVLENCALEKLGTTATGSAITIGLNSASATFVWLKNSRIKLTAVTDGVLLRAVDFRWTDSPGAVTLNASASLLYTASGALPGGSLHEGVDLSGVPTTIAQAGGGSPRKFVYKDCKLNASAILQGAPTSAAGFESYVMRSDSGGTNYRNEKYTYSGSLQTSLNVVRTGGASDGATAVSWLCTTLLARFKTPFESLPIAIWNPVSGSNVTATVECLMPLYATIPTNLNMWMDVEYMGSGSSPLASLATTAAADYLAAGTSYSASTAAWDSAAPARANTTVYAIGDIVKVASNPGRVFFCSSPGTSAGSEPGGYASAVDAGFVTDGTATFWAAIRFKMAVTLTSPGQAGLIYATVRFNTGVSLTNSVYVDPFITLS